MLPRSDYNEAARPAEWKEYDVVRIALGSRLVGTRVGEDHGPAVGPRLLGAGRDLCAALAPGTDLDAIRASLEENRDGRRMLLQDGALPLDEVKEIREEVGKAAKGASLSPTELLRIGKTARVGERVRRFFEDRRGKYPRLAHHANRIPPLRDVAEAVEQAIDANGNVLDRASDELGPLRRQLLKMRSRLQETAEGILTSPATPATSRRRTPPSGRAGS